MCVCVCVCACVFTFLKPQFCPTFCCFLFVSFFLSVFVSFRFFLFLSFSFASFFSKRCKAMNSDLRKRDGLMGCRDSWPAWPYHDSHHMCKAWRISGVWEACHGRICDLLQSFYISLLLHTCRNVTINSRGAWQWYQTTHQNLPILARPTIHTIR